VVYVTESTGVAGLGAGPALNHQEQQLYDPNGKAFGILVTPSQKTHDAMVRFSGRRDADYVVVHGLLNRMARMASKGEDANCVSGGSDGGGGDAA
jgi:hypothetical protein